VNRTVAYSVALLGLWVLVAPFVFGVGAAAMWNDVIVGAAITGLGGYNGYVASTSSQSQPQPA
jgi:hypothetical protein